MPVSYLNPDIIGRLAGIGLKANQPVEGTIAGQHRSPLHGLSPEFADYRAYTPGDDLKNLDWKAYGRSDRFYIKRYEEESNLRAFLIVDDSASMDYGEGETNKFHCAATIGCSLAATLLKQRDAVGLSTVSNVVSTEIRPSGTTSQLGKLVDALEQVKCSGETDLGPAVSTIAEKVPRRGVVILISDLLTDLVALYDGLGKLQYFGHEVLIFHVLHRDEVEMPFNDSVIFRDIEGDEELFAEPWSFRSAYQNAMQTFIEEVRERCHFCGIDYLQILTDDPLGIVLSHHLHNRQFRGSTKHRGRMAALTQTSEVGEQKSDTPADANSETRPPTSGT
jgi:uncharacterized protein (DUF58 family)